MPSSARNIVHQSRPAAIIGNGPSLKGFNFKTHLHEFDTFGMNAAYRHWDSIGWYPDYYSCLDRSVGLSHKDAICRMIERSQEYGIKQFLLRENLVRALGEVGKRSCVCNFDELQNASNIYQDEALITTGSHTCAWASLIGYRHLILLGIDSKYVNIIKEAKPVEGIVFEIAENPTENPNYFFADYQVKGDKYQIPVHQSQPDEAAHQTTWRIMHEQLTHANVIIVNANPQSLLDTFPKCTFESALGTLAAIRAKKNDHNLAHDQTADISLEEV